MNWRPARNSTPPSAETMRAEVAAVGDRIARLTGERDEIEAALPDLVGDPATRREAEDRLAAVTAELSRDRRTVALIEEAIPAAEEREARAFALARRDDLERRTAKLSRNLEARYDAAATALAAVLSEIEENEREWQVVNRDLDVGQTGRSLEHRLRSGLSGARKLGVFYSLVSESRVVGFDGAVLFDGIGR